MPMNQAILPEYDREMATTRKFLERVPEDKFDWAPHPKSMKLGDLASHLTHMPGWLVSTFSQDVLDVAPGGKMMELPKGKNRQELLALFDKSVAAGRAALAAATDDAQWMKPWTLQVNGQTMFSMPRAAVVRAFVLSHSIHHRAQLGVYLRLNNVPVPATYGPSADEQKF
jgi:uncharacterized damage-inducible protein DinB